MPDAETSAPAAPPLRLIVPLVALAGAVGALARLTVGELLPEQSMKFPWTTLAVNLSGSGLLGLLTGVASVHRLPRWVVPTLGTGLLGSYTTFSLVIVAVMPAVPGAMFDELAAQTYVNPAAPELIAYLLISILGCTAAAAAGITVGRAIFGAVGPPQPGARRTGAAR